MPGMIVIYAMAIIIRIFARKHTYIRCICAIYTILYYTILCVSLSVRIVHNKQKIQFSFSFIQNSNNSQSERVFALLDFISLGCGFVFLSHCDLYAFALFLFPFVCCSLLIHFQIYLYTDICIHIYIYIHSFMYKYVVVIQT